MRVVRARISDRLSAALLRRTNLCCVGRQSLVAHHDCRPVQARQQLTQRNRRFLRCEHRVDLARNPLACCPREFALSLRPRLDQRTIVRQRRAVPHEAPAVRG